MQRRYQSFRHLSDEAAAGALERRADREAVVTDCLRQLAYPLSDRVGRTLQDQARSKASPAPNIAHTAHELGYLARPSRPPESATLALTRQGRWNRCGRQRACVMLPREGLVHFRCSIVPGERRPDMLKVLATWSPVRYLNGTTVEPEESRWLVTVIRYRVPCPLFRSTTCQTGLRAPGGADAGAGCGGE